MASQKKDFDELYKRVNKIRLLTLHLVSEELSGEYHSSFKGQGIEFDEVRPYIHGDDVRSIDWNVTARTGEAHIKRFSEERELTVLFLVDVSASQGCGAGRRTKSELTALVTSLLAMSATANGDNVGLVNFSDKIEKVIPPKRGQKAVMRLVRDVLASEDGGKGATDIKGALRSFNNYYKRRALVFLISDFLDDDFSRELRAIASRHDLIAVSVSDESEISLPDAGLVELMDPESGEIMLVDSSSEYVRRVFNEMAKARREKLGRLFKSSGIEEIALSTSDGDDEIVRKVRSLFLKRSKKGA